MFVVCREEGPLELFWNKDVEKHLLYFGDNITVFPTLVAARKALKRTNKFSKNQDLSWHTWPTKIMPLVYYLFSMKET